MPTIKELYKEHGYFSLIFEKMDDWEWYTDLPCFKLMVHLIIKCMKKDTRYAGEEVKRGQYRTSRSRLAEETGLSIKQVRNAIKKLEKTNELKAAKSRAKQRTLITLCNFEKYQPELILGGQGRGQAGAKVGPRYKEEVSSKDIVGQEMNGEFFKEVVGYLNQKTGKNFKHTTEATRKHISARVKEGYTVEDFKKVIDNKTAQWKGDPKWDVFLRPETLFLPSKFESYLNEQGGGGGIDKTKPY